MIVFITTLVSISNSLYPSAQRFDVLDDRNAQTQQKSLEFRDRDCLPWFYIDSETRMCHCFPYYGCKCFEQNATLQLGFCATYDVNTRLVSLPHCPYFQSHHYELFNSQYVLLPRNLSVLNDYMCKPLNREGKACGSV